MWGLLLACTVVSLNLMIEQIGSYEEEMAQRSSQMAFTLNS